MAIEGFDYKEQWIGTGDTNLYSFDFLIFDPSEVLAYLQDDSGAMVGIYRGNDPTFFSGVTFDSDGGGQVTLVADLAENYILSLFLANDLPDQPSSWPNARSFTLDALESALDYMAAWGQRIAFLAQRAVKLHPLDDLDDFDPTMPINASLNPGGVLSIKQDGTGLEFGATVQQLDPTAAANASAYQVIPNIALPAQSPQVVVATVGIAVQSVKRQMMFVSSGSGGAISMTANPQVAPGNAPGNELTLVGCDGSNTVQLANGNGLLLSGNMVLANGSVLSLGWNGQVWFEISRRT